MDRHVRRSSWASVLVALVLLPAAAAHGQFWDRLTNPRVTTLVSHPPGLGIQVKKVSFGPASGQGAEEFVDALTSRFLQANVEVIERQRLEALLKEHDFNLTGYVDKQSVAEIGRIVGPSVMVFVSMQRRAVEKKSLYQDSRDTKGYAHRTFISRTQAFVKGSVRSVDLASGRIFAATTFDASPMLENKVTDQCCAEFPSEFGLLDEAQNQVVRQVERLFLPWSETVDLVYFDDKDCGLKVAHAYQKAGDVEGALRQSIANLEQCQALPKVNAKTLAHAYHNVGMGYFARGEHDKAIEHLEAAERTKHGEIFTEAIAECRRAETLARDMQRVEERAALEEVSTETRRARAEQAESDATLTNDQVLALVNAKLGPEIITSKIQSSKCRFDTSANALIRLKQAGVPDQVIVAMMSGGKK